MTWLGAVVTLLCVNLKLAQTLQANGTYAAPTQEHNFLVSTRAAFSEPWVKIIVAHCCSVVYTRQCGDLVVAELLKGQPEQGTNTLFLVPAI